MNNRETFYRELDELLAQSEHDLMLNKKSTNEYQTVSLRLFARVIELAKTIQLLYIKKKAHSENISEIAVACVARTLLECSFRLFFLNENPKMTWEEFLIEDKLHRLKRLNLFVSENSDNKDEGMLAEVDKCLTTIEVLKEETQNKTRYNLDRKLDSHSEKIPLHPLKDLYAHLCALTHSNLLGLSTISDGNGNITLFRDLNDFDFEYVEKAITSGMRASKANFLCLMRNPAL